MSKESQTKKSCDFFNIVFIIEAMSWQAFLKSILKSYNLTPKLLATSHQVSVSYIYHMLNEKKTSGSYKKTVELVRFLRAHGVRQDLLANLVRLIIVEKKKSKEIDKLELYYSSLVREPMPDTTNDPTSHIDAYIHENIRPLRLSEKKQIVMQINQFLLNAQESH